MQSTVVRTRAGTLTVRSLRNGDTNKVQAVFDALSDQSRRLRFGYTKPALDPKELAELSRADGLHHVLVGYIAGTPVGIARLVRDGGRRHIAEVAYAVADEWQGYGIGT